MKVIRIFQCLFNQTMNMNLEVKATINKLKGVFLSFNKSKGLGISGLNMEFYIGFYYLLEKGILRVVEESINSRML